jgi:hypothetical protein
MLTKTDLGEFTPFKPSNHAGLKRLGLRSPISPKGVMQKRSVFSVKADIFGKLFLSVIGVFSSSTAITANNPQ